MMRGCVTLCLGSLGDLHLDSLGFLVDLVLGLDADLSATPFLLEIDVVVEQLHAELLQAVKILIVLQSKRKLRSGLFMIPPS